MDKSADFQSVVPSSILDNCTKHDHTYHMAAYYNEIDPYAAQWLRNLIAAGHIAPGDVDDRSIEDVRPDDLRNYTQCHFFAGLGAWSLALRRAGWPDDRPVWTGSCPCQPFSSAGSGSGFADSRHLWPNLSWLIRQCRPSVAFGEQVASKASGPWIDLVQADVEAMGYAFGAIPFPAASVGAPHIRDRLYWVADTTDKRCDGWRTSEASNGHHATWVESERLRDAGRMADLYSDGRDQTRQRVTTTGDDGVVGDSSALAGPSSPGPVNGLWANADWLRCQDGKWRPVEPGTFPLVNGAPSRMGRLRAYGNAVNAEAATQFIAAYLETLN